MKFLLIANEFICSDRSITLILLRLMKESWLIVSDSGGVQEEAPSLGKPLFVLRENTERPEAIESGVAKLVGGDSEVLAEMLNSNYNDQTWINSVNEIANPFRKRNKRKTNC